MEGRYNERNARYRVVKVLARMPDIHLLQEPVWLGIFSWSLDKSKERWIKGNTVVNLGFGAQTPGDVVRDYLDFKYPKRLRASGGQAREITRHRATPLYCRPGVLLDGVYVDIKSAYYSLVNLVGWNVDYYPGKWIVPGMDAHDFPLGTDTTRVAKAARACLVSVGLSKLSTKWNGRRYVQVKTRNNHVNYGLWAVCQDILHAIASFAVSIGAIYAHTDGYILPNGAASLLEEFIADWGLLSGRKGQGKTLVLGFGNFLCGDFRTKRIRPIIGRNYASISAIDGAWLQRQLRHRIQGMSKPLDTL